MSVELDKVYVFTRAAALIGRLYEPDGNLKPDAYLTIGDARGINTPAPEPVKLGTRANPFPSSASLTAGPMPVGLIMGFR